MTIEEIRKRRTEIESEINKIIFEFEQEMGGYLGKNTPVIKSITFSRDSMGWHRLLSNINLEV